MTSETIRIAANITPHRKYIMELEHWIATCADPDEQARTRCDIQELEYDEIRWLNRQWKQKIVRWSRCTSQ